MAEPLAGCYIPCIGTPCYFLVFGPLNYLSYFFVNTVREVPAV
jgi:hypothetical protein